TFGAQLFAAPSAVGEAALYSLFSGGKRVRGVITIAVCDLFGGDLDIAAGFGAALEMLHCYSLIHDDLPCMDDSDTRRGRPSCHKKYGETVALLAGDALLTTAFEALARTPATKAQIADATLCLASAAGPSGMVYGQELDLAFEHKIPTQEDLLNIHRHKTGELINAAAALGAISASASTAGDAALLLEYSNRLGLVFQIVDDILDVTATQQELGKPVGNDVLHEKITFATLHGVEQARATAEAVTREACTLLAERYGEKSDFLRELAASLLIRKN
ncbi:MAG: polyprenyl synthetase family protein, partial [Pygmaiobacter sp.]